MDLYTKNSLEISKITTKNYSTSFSLGVKLLHRQFRDPIYAIYGFVRVADEIVDTFHDQDKERLLKEFRKDTYFTIEYRMSTNPILHSFQWVVNEYGIDIRLIDAFLESMEMDLEKKLYNKDEFKKYVYGSAEVVGLMCLQVFYRDQEEEYEKLVYPARKLGEAFQKINFLRDIKEDWEERGRFYFPGLSSEEFDNGSKRKLEEELRLDFEEAYKGILQLNKQARLGVLISYSYYMKLFRKIRKTDASALFAKRIRISNFRKILILLRCWLKVKLSAK